MAFTDYDHYGSQVLTETQQTVRKCWTNVLRAGQYKQGNNQLQTLDGRYCCLGVLCDLVDPEGWQTDQRFPRSLPMVTLDEPVVPAMQLEAHRTHRGDTSYPSEDVARTAGLTRIQMDYLARRNDIDGWSFKRIADEVDAGFPGMTPEGGRKEPGYPF